MAKLRLTGGFVGTVCIPSYEYLTVVVRGPRNSDIGANLFLGGGLMGRLKAWIILPAGLLRCVAVSELILIVCFFSLRAVI